MPDEFHYRWQYDLQSSPEALWPYVADTNRFNHDTGLPHVEDALAQPTELENARRRLRLWRMGMRIEWQEEPFEWVRPYRYGVRRIYSSGPVAEMRTLGELVSRPEGGARLVYQVWARPRNLLGQIVIPLQIGWLSARSFAAAFRRYDHLAVAGEWPSSPAGRIVMAPGSINRLAEARRSLEAQQPNLTLVARLFDLVEHSDEITLSRLRPYALADYWGEPRQPVLELFLQATRAGVLDLQWHILCPLCRGDKATAFNLADLGTSAHCEVCHIDLTANFDRAVELTFRPNPAVRALDVHPYCVGGPQVTPHILAQQLLPPHSERTLSLPLEPGRHRLRSLELPGGQYFRVESGGKAETTFRASAKGWAEEEPKLGLAPTLCLANATDHEQLLILERMAWTDQAVTAAEVTTMQTFRDLFSSEALRPGEQISVGSLTIVFTDLRDSTRIYRAIGDAPAFGLVMGHFDILRREVMAQDGAIVKTIGDSVMAAFRRPISGLRAILNAEQALTALSDKKQPLVLKAGIHHGPCIAVTLNKRLDYFGSTVNLASRIQGLSLGNDVALSAAVLHDPEVAAWLQQEEPNLQIEHLRTTLKGIEETVEVYRLATRAELPSN